MIVFSDPDIWNGGDFELWMSFESSAALTAALVALWSHPALRGPYASFDLDPALQKRASPHRMAASGADALSEAAGILRLPDDTRLAVSVSRIIDAEEDDTNLILGLPAGGLERLRDVNETLPGGNYAWEAPLAEHLRAIGERVWNAAPFTHAAVGWELVLYNLDTILAHPSVRGDVGVLRAEAGELVWYPPIYE